MMPIGGKTLFEMRMQGARPPGFIVVTESREVARNARQRELYPLIFEEGKAYDWTLLRGLQVRICTHLRREKVAPICASIFEAEPLTLACTYYNDDPEHDTVIPHAVR